MKVLISGYYGFGNVGDEAVLQAIIQGLLNHDSNIEITVLSASPSLTKDFYKINSIYSYDWLKIFAKMLKVDVFISGGGTLFQNVTSNRSFLYYLGLVMLARLMGKRVVIFAQGFGPLNGKFNRGLARLVLNRVKLITLRDKDSYHEIQKLGIKKPAIHVTGDPSAILKNSSAEEGIKILSLEGVRKTDRPLLGVSVRSVPKREEEKLYESLAKTIDWLSKEYHYTPVFILFQCPEDMQETSRVISFMHESSNVIFRICHPDEMLALISQFDLLIGMRLHSLIFATMNCVPMLGLSYDPKVEAFMRSIEQPCLKIDQDLDFQNIKDVLEKILIKKEKTKASLERKREKLYEQAALNFDLFFSSLKK